VQGIEALSRGASFAVFVERRADAAALLRENLIKTKFTDQAEVVCGNVGDYLRRTAAAGLPPFDLCLFDPPFAFSLSPETRTELEQLLAATGTILNAHGLLVLRSERQCTPPTPEGLILKRHWTDGPHSLFFYKKNS
jgi:16S rRNA G966 N2-methylase RsmD